MPPNTAFSIHDARDLHARFHGARTRRDSEPKQHHQYLEQSGSPGDVIVIYATGEGQVRPAGTDGRITTGTVDCLPRPILPVVVKLAGVPCRQKTSLMRARLRDWSPARCK